MCSFVFLIGLFQGLLSGQEQVSQPPPPVRPRRDVRQAPPADHDDDDHFFSDDGEAGQGGGSGDAGQGGARAKVKAAPSRTASTLPSKTASTKSASTVKTAARHARTHARTASVRGIFLSFPDLIESNLFPNLTSYSLLFSPTFTSRSRSRTNLDLVFRSAQLTQFSFPDLADVSIPDVTIPPPGYSPLGAELFTRPAAAGPGSYSR